MMQNAYPNPVPNAAANPANPPGRGTMQNLNPTRIIARRGRDIMLIGALVLLGGLVVGAFSLLVLLIATSSLISGLVIFISVAMVVIGIGLIVRGLTYRRDNEIAREVGETLARELDERYVFIRNLSRRGLGYIDALLIGPPGALVFRITEVSGIFLNEGSDWLERQGGKDFALARHNFTRECVTDIYALRSYLAKANMSTVPIYGIIVFTNGQAQVSTRQPVVPVAELRTLMQVMRRDYLALDNRISADQVGRTVNLVFN